MGMVIPYPQVEQALEVVGDRRINGQTPQRLPHQGEEKCSLLVIVLHASETRADQTRHGSSTFEVPISSPMKFGALCKQ